MQNQIDDVTQSQSKVVKVSPKQQYFIPAFYKKNPSETRQCEWNRSYFTEYKKNK